MSDHNQAATNSPPAVRRIVLIIAVAAAGFLLVAELLEWTWTGTLNLPPTFYSLSILCLFLSNLAVPNRQTPRALLLVMAMVCLAVGLFLRFWS
jgi:hypothetical protein